MRTFRSCTRAGATFYHLATGPEPDDWAVDEQLAELGRVLGKRIDTLATAMAGQITAEVSFYREQPTVPPAELRDSCRAHLEYVLGSLGAPAPRDISPAGQNGRRRADADVPLPALMDAYRVGTRFIWECFVAEAQRSGSPDSATLVRASSQVWLLQADFIEAMSAGYRDAMTARVLSREHERSALVGALLEGRITETRTLWETAEILRLTRRGPYLVVAAAERLFVHPNTVRHRLRRITAAAGRSLTAPRDVAELCLALEAARQQPGTA